MVKPPLSRRFAGLALALLLLSLLPALTTARSPLVPVDASLWDEMELRGRAQALVILEEQADLEGARLLPTKEEKGWYVYRQLTAAAERTQPPLRRFLQSRGASYRSYWIRNMVLVEADAGLLLALAGRPEVARLEALPRAYQDLPLAAPAPAPTPNAVEWNIARVHADLVWALGITGTGVVVGNLDTGESYTHTALVRSYRGCVDPPACTTFDHDYNWWDGPGGVQEPKDFGYHGTHTLGTILGDDGAGNQVGMAPGAQWIACPGDPQDGGDPNLSPFECFQWFLAPTKLDGSDPRPDLAPDVINCSWTWTGDYRDIIHTLSMAGIFYSKSGGNTGPACGTTTNPGQYLEVTATGAFAQGDTIASFSSRGPVVLDYETVLKPDIAAPGVDVRSSLPGGQYGTLSGTSMSAPHTTGAVALILSARPELRGQIDTLQHILKSTAEPKIDAQCPPYIGHPNNVWGWGILDAYAAVQYAQTMALGRIQGTVTAAATGDPLTGARVELSGGGGGWNLLPLVTDGSGGYSSLLLPDDTYHVTATLYGCLPGTATVTLPGGLTVTRDISLSTAPQWTVSGTVVQTGTLAPLRATVVFSGSGVVAQTDPASGAYGAAIYQGTYWTLVNSPGHTGRIVRLPVEGGRTDDYALTPIANYYPRTSDQPCGPAFQWVDARDGTRLCLNDNAFNTVALGRAFTFYGNTYGNLYVGSNGIATFQLPANNYPLRIPDPATPNNGIYAFGMDLNPGGGCSQGELFYKAVGDTFVVEYYQVQHAPNGDPETFEILLDFATGLVTVQYLTVSSPLGVVAGVENAQGTEATAYGGTVHGGLAVAYAPAFGAPPYEQGVGALAGRVVVSDTGTPLPGAVVNALNPISATFTATTDISGSYLLPLCADFYTVSAAAAGYTPSTPLRVTVYSDSTTVQAFALEPPPCEPVQGAGFGWTPPTPTVGEIVTFTGAASGTPPLSYTWRLAEGSWKEGPVVTHSYSLPGLYTVALTATNCATATDTAAYTVTVVPPCVPAEVLTITAAVSGCSATFAAEVTGTAPFVYLWALGDGMTSTAATPTHTYTQTGTYSGTLEVQNCGGASTQGFAVQVACPPPPFTIYLPLVARGYTP